MNTFLLSAIMFSFGVLATLIWVARVRWLILRPVIMKISDLGWFCVRTPRGMWMPVFPLNEEQTRAYQHTIASIESGDLK